MHVTFAAGCFSGVAASVLEKPPAKAKWERREVSMIYIDGHFSSFLAVWMTAAQLCICVGQYRSCIWYHNEAQRPGSLEDLEVLRAFEHAIQIQFKYNSNQFNIFNSFGKKLCRTPQTPSRQGGLLSDCLFSRGAGWSKPFDKKNRRECTVPTVPACPSRGEGPVWFTRCMQSSNRGSISVVCSFFPHGGQGIGTNFVKIKSNID